MNVKPLATIGALAFGMAAGAAQALSVPINIVPDGGTSSFLVGSLDWNVGNSIAVAAPENCITVGACDGAVSVGAELKAYAHAALGNFLDDEGNVVPGTNLNNNFQWTFVSGFKESITATGGLDPFGTTNTQVISDKDNFFRIYYDPNFNSDNLTGKGFGGAGEGTLILEIKGLEGNAAGSGTFTPTAGQPVDAATGLPTTVLDGFGVNQYSNYKTITGQGSTTVTGDVTFFNPAFFPDFGLGQLINLNFTTQQALNYLSTNPSSCFLDGVNYFTGAGNGIAGGCGAGGDFGTIGQWNGVTGNNVIFQTDASTSFLPQAVPEPGTLALLGVALAGLGGIRRRRTQI